MFKNLKIENFRGLTELEIDDLRQFNLFVGKNNSGKSTILEAIFLLINPSNPELPLKISSFRDTNIFKPENWDLLFHNLEKNLDIKLSCELDNSEIRFLKIRPQINSTINVELTPTIKSMEKIETGNLSKQNGLELVYSFNSVDDIANEIITSFRIEETPKGPEIKLKNVKNLPPELSSLKGVFVSSKVISEGIGNRFGKIVENNDEERITQIVKKIDPQLKDLKLGPDNIVLCDVGLKRSLPLNVMGEGLVKILAIIVAIAEVENGILVIDEIENGLHVTSQEILWRAIFETAMEYNVQIFATTHSSECLEAMILSANDIYDKNMDKIRLYRLERDVDQFKTIIYTPKLLFTSLEKGWEVR